MPPHAITARLELRPASHDDLDVLWALWAAPEVRRFLLDDVPVTRERAAGVLGPCLQAAEAGLGLWVARRRDTETVIGCVDLMAASTAARYEPRLVGAIEPLAAFAPSVWGHGYATEALAAVVRYAFGALGWSQLAAVNDVPNDASDRREVSRRNVMDEDLNEMTREELIDEVKKLRRGIRQHRDSSLHELCWHHPSLWGLLPEKTDPIPAVPEWPEFIRGCVRYRQSLDEQAPNAPRTNQRYDK